MKPEVVDFYHANSGTFSYLAFDPEERVGVVIDPVLDFDVASGLVSYDSADAILAYADKHQISVHWVLETHAHADHLTAAQFIKQKTGAKVAIGQGITQVQKTFSAIYNFPKTFNVEGQQFDRRFIEGDEIRVGQLTITVLETPGHTNDSVTYLIGDAAFIGDTMFHPSVGTARCDFPGGNATTLYHSIQRILALPADTRIYLCHDYPEAGRQVTCLVSIAEQKANNIHVSEDKTEQEFIRFRTERDNQLAVPNLLYPSVQVNIAAGKFPEPEKNQEIYLKTPVRFIESGVENG